MNKGGEMGRVILCVLVVKDIKDIIDKFLEVLI
jgi:hypothetical protein